MYKENDLLQIAKRENNNKRNYLVINKLQGKHIPVEPSQALGMFKELAMLLKKAYTNEKILFIGFAETATAIGAAVSSYFDAFYIQTTREDIPGADYLFFSEEHSHATEQRLVKNGLDRIIPGINHIIFIEDEVTTGNTILNIIKILKTEYPYINKYSVASLVNGMSEEHLQVYKNKGIELYYLLKTDNSKYTGIAARFAGNGEYILPDVSGNTTANVTYYNANNYIDARIVVNTTVYNRHINKLCQYVIGKNLWSGKKNILVAGTEEFMYPALCIGQLFEQKGKNVKSHSTTRSPVVVSSEKEYPLHVRYELKSLYNDERTTFLYDIGKYDCVIIVTDAMYTGKKGINTLINALSTKNKEIYVIRWC